LAKAYDAAKKDHYKVGRDDFEQNDLDTKRAIQVWEESVVIRNNLANTHKELSNNLKVVNGQVALLKKNLKHSENNLTKMRTWEALDPHNSSSKQKVSEATKLVEVSTLQLKDAVDSRTKIVNQRKVAQEHARQALIEAAKARARAEKAYTKQ
jgi:hypothetical protein